MYKQNSLITRYCLAVAVILALLGPLAGQSRGDFVLLNDEQLTVNSSHSYGTLYDTSRAFIVFGGSMECLTACNSSTVDISGGEVGELWAYDSSTTNISGGSLSILNAHDYSTVNMSSGSVIVLYAYNSSIVGMSGGFVMDHLCACSLSVVDISGGSVPRLLADNLSTTNISGGSIEYLTAYSASTTNISGGSVVYINAKDSSTVNISGGGGSWLYAYDSSVVTFYGRDFLASGGLILDGERVLGLGTLSGAWMDGTRWAANIHCNDPTATIQAIPEPATLLLFALGAVMWRRKSRPKLQINKIRNI
jgi:hypothetical protein